MSLLRSKLSGTSFSLVNLGSNWFLSNYPLRGFSPISVWSSFGMGIGGCSDVSVNSMKPCFSSNIPSLFTYLTRDPPTDTRSSRGYLVNKTGSLEFGAWVTSTDHWGDWRTFRKDLIQWKQNPEFKRFLLKISSYSLCFIIDSYSSLFWDTHLWPSFFFFFWFLCGSFWSLKNYIVGF